MKHLPRIIHRDIVRRTQRDQVLDGGRDPFDAASFWVWF